MSFNHSIASNSDAILQSPKIAAGISGSTFAVGSATWLDWLPGDIGFYASAVGIVLSLVFIYNNIKGGIIKRRLDLAEFKVAQLEQEKLKHELQEMRRENG